tara:strand:+ start:41 stop:583 length:543 start_codon:yes stop_codon:yes gene_type:complete
MATFVILPNADIITEWDASGGGAVSYTDVDNDDGDTQYAFSDTNNERMVFELETPSVASGDVESIDTVQIIASARYTAGRGSSMYFMQRGTAADSSAISNGTDTISVTGSGSYSIYSGTAETTSDGTNAWEYGDLAGLRLRVQKYQNSAGEIRVSYLYARITYTPAAVTADNATFFGANF